MLTIIENPDIERRKLAEEALNIMEGQYGKRYCPCSVVHDEDSICPCKDFRDKIEAGECYCGRYMKVER